MLKSLSYYFQNAPDISKKLKNYQDYRAHLPTTEGDKIETLEEHIVLVNKYAERLSKEHQLDVVVDSLLFSILENVQIGNKELLANSLKQLFVHTIVFHDFGKINEDFQAKRMKNPKFKPNSKSVFTPPHGHSFLGTYLYYIHHINALKTLNDEDEQVFLAIATLFFGYSILMHHQSVLTKPEKKIKSLEIENLIDKLNIYVKQYNLDEDTSFMKILFNDLNGFIDTYKGKQIDTFSLFALLKLNFSLLTASDYLATSEYMNGTPLKDLGLITNDLRAKVIDGIKFKKNYNKEAYDNYKSDYVFQNPSIASGANLNILRQEMTIEVIKNVRENADKNLFYIEAPTGGGKTNLSMIACAELLESNPNLNKVFYVFPFTTLITQTHKAIIETLGLSPDEVVQLHSKAGFQTKTKEESEDGQYGDEKQDYIDNLFVNYPFCLLTHIKFFDILKSNHKETNYLLHRLANSIVIIDELQSYNPGHWDKMIYFIINYAKHFNIKFVLMSATLPEIGKLNVIKDYKPDFVYLLENVKRKYFNNPNFSGRVNFNFDLLEKKEIKLEDLATIVVEKSLEYSNKNTLYPNSVFTIIEFIFKKTATKFYDLVDKKAFDEVFVLSGTIVEPRRKEIINYLKHSENRTKKMLLITTQVVEAGVDIDMDLGFKDTSLIDSDEQLAGRINRNVNKEKCELYLFNLDKQSVIYGKDERFKQVKEGKISIQDHKEILETKNFNKLYDLVMSDIDKWNGTPMAAGFKDYLSDMQMLDFKDVNHKFRLIEQENLSVFVPLDIPIKVRGQKGDEIDNIFSSNELAFLAKANIFPNEDEKIDGKEVFDFYIDLIHNRKKKDFIKAKIDFKIMQGIMSKFVFSTFATDDMRRKLTSFCEYHEEKYGYYVLRKNTITDEKEIENDSIVYSYYFGINDKAFTSIDASFL